MLLGRAVSSTLSVISGSWGEQELHLGLVFWLFVTPQKAKGRCEKVQEKPLNYLLVLKSTILRVKWFLLYFLSLLSSHTLGPSCYLWGALVSLSKIMLGLSNSLNCCKDH